MRQDVGRINLTSGLGTWSQILRSPDPRSQMCHPEGGPTKHQKRVENGPKRDENGPIPDKELSRIPKMDQMGENMNIGICRLNVGTFLVFWANSALLLFCLKVLIWLYLGHFHPVNMILPIYHFSDRQIWDRSSDRRSKIWPSEILDPPRFWYLKILPTPNLTPNPRSWKWTKMTHFWTKSDQKGSIVRTPSGWPLLRPYFGACKKG